MRNLQKASFVSILAALLDLARKSVVTDIMSSIDNDEIVNSVNKSIESVSIPTMNLRSALFVPKRITAKTTSQSKEGAKVSTSSPKEITGIDKRCPSSLRYPTFSHPKECFNHNMSLLLQPIMFRIVWPYRSLKHHPKPLHYIYETGVVFYVYAGNRCKGNNRYLSQVLTNARAIKEKDPSVGC